MADKGQKKRQLIETENQNELSYKSPIKKRKLNSISSMFESREFHREFLSIYKAIDDSNLSKILNIPSIIIKEISEYSTGRITECICFNKSCKKEFVALDCDKKQHEKYGECKEFGYFKYGNYYFCTFECIQCIKCGYLFDEIIGDVYTMKHFCHSCHNIMCHSCIDLCDCCSNGFCHECAAFCNECLSEGWNLILHSEDHTSHCEFDGEVLCKDHVIECALCGGTWCDQHFDGNNSYCGECLDEIG